jgi:SSS family solute:Na+ symporter
LKLVFPLLLVLPGLIAVAMFHQKLGPPGTWKEESGVANQLLPMMVKELLPTGVLGIVLGAFLAGVLSNLDSYINSASTLVVNDLYRPIVRRADDRHYLLVGRWLVVVFLVAGAAVAYFVVLKFDSVYKAFQTFMTFFQGPLLALLLLGMLTRRATQWGGLAGMLIGVGTAAVMHSVQFWPGEYEIPYLWVAWWSFVAAVGGTMLVSLITRPYDRERLRGLVCWIPANNEEAPA